MLANILLTKTSFLAKSHINEGGEYKGHKRDAG